MNPAIGIVQGIDETPRSGQFAFMTDMFRIDIAASFLIEHRFDPQHDIEDRPEQQGHAHSGGNTVPLLRALPCVASL